MSQPLVHLPEIVVYVALALAALIVLGVIVPRLDRWARRNRGVLRAIPVVVLVVGAAVAGVMFRH